MSTLHFTDRQEIPCPVKCDYCSTVDTIGRQNCASCGGPLPRPEVREIITERSIRMTREMLDCTSMEDMMSVYQVGIKSGTLHETVHSVERIK